MIGLLPAAGEASRMNGLPKYLLPVPAGTLMDIHVNQMWAAGCEPIYIGANDDNYHLLRNHTDGRVYLASQRQTMSETVLSSNLAIDSRACLFGMPDTYVEDEQAYGKLASALNDGADLAVGLFYTRPEQRSSLDMVIMADQRIVNVIDKPEMTDLEWAWGVLGWRPAFWEHIKPEDPHVGYAIPRAIAAGLDVRAVKMDGGYWDCGTPDEYFMLIHTLMSPKWPEPR